MLIPQPLRIHVGPEIELLLFNNKPIGGLFSFELDYNPEAIVRSKYECAGCFPFMLPEAPERSLSNSEFPLRIYVGPTSDESLAQQTLNAWFYGRPLPVMKLFVRLHGEEKRIIRMHVSTELPQEVLDALLDFGVEVITHHAPGNV